MKETILAVDPSLRGTGFAILERTGSKVHCVEFGVIKNSPRLTISGCLVAMNEHIAEAITRAAPEVMARLCVM